MLQMSLQQLRQQLRCCSPVTGMQAATFMSDGADSFQQGTQRCLIQTRPTHICILQLLVMQGPQGDADTRNCRHWAAGSIAAGNDDRLKSPSNLSCMDDPPAQSCNPPGPLQQNACDPPARHRFADSDCRKWARQHPTSCGCFSSCAGQNGDCNGNSSRPLARQRGFILHAAIRN